MKHFFSNKEVSLFFQSIKKQAVFKKLKYAVWRKFPEMWFLEHFPFSIVKVLKSCRIQRTIMIVLNILSKNVRFSVKMRFSELGSVTLGVA